MRSAGRPTGARERQHPLRDVARRVRPSPPTGTVGERRESHGVGEQLGDGAAEALIAEVRFAQVVHQARTDAYRLEVLHVDEASA